MAAIDLAHIYFRKVNGQDGTGVAELFAGDGVIVDPTGHRHQGWWEIAAFVTSAAPGTVAHIADRHMSADRAVIHGTVQTANLSPAEIEWEFQTNGDRIERLTIRTMNGPAHDETTAPTSSDRQ